MTDTARRNTGLQTLKDWSAPRTGSAQTYTWFSKTDCRVCHDLRRITRTLIKVNKASPCSSMRAYFQLEWRNAKDVVMGGRICRICSCSALQQALQSWHRDGGIYSSPSFRSSTQQTASLFSFSTCMSTEAPSENRLEGRGKKAGTPIQKKRRKISSQWNQLISEAALPVS